MGQVVSMTGIGVGAAEGVGLRLRIILRSVNGRFFDLQVRCPQGMQEFEPAIRDRLQKHVGRGKMSANLEREESVEAAVLPTLNEDLARRYLDELRRLSELAGGERGAEEPGLDTVARLPGVFRAEAESVEPEHVASLVFEALESAIREFDSTREAEGRALVKDLKARLERINRSLDMVEEKTTNSREDILERLRQKVETLLNPGEIDETRLATEVVLIADRSDITEEIVRFRSHNAQFLEAIDKGGEVGKRLGFLLQEMNREANTISSKSVDTDVIHTVVDIKEEVERIREQVQNLA